MADYKRRSAFLAGLFNFIAPGLGFLYVGNAKYAIALPSILVLLFALSSWTKIIFRPVGFLSTVILFFLLWFGSVVLAGLMVRWQGDVAPKRFQRWYIYVAFFVISSVLREVLLANRGQLFGYETFRFPSMSMADTLLFNDFIVSDAWKYRDDIPRRGELIIFLYPKDLSVKYIKRVIGLPGEVVEIKGGVVYVNGKELNEPYVKPENKVHTSQTNSQYIVPEHGFFVMGDNRDNSSDSRFWGSVPRENVYGSVEFIWLSFNEGLNLRTERIGKIVK